MFFACRRTVNEEVRLDRRVRNCRWRWSYRVKKRRPSPLRSIMERDWGSARGAHRDGTAMDGQQSIAIWGLTLKTSHLNEMVRWYELEVQFRDPVVAGRRMTRGTTGSHSWPCRASRTMPARPATTECITVRLLRKYDEPL